MEAANKEKLRLLAVRQLGVLWKERVRRPTKTTKNEQEKELEEAKKEVESRSSSSESRKDSLEMPVSVCQDRRVNISSKILLFDFKSKINISFPLDFTLLKFIPAWQRNKHD